MRYELDLLSESIDLAAKFNRCIVNSFRSRFSFLSLALLTTTNYYYYHHHFYHFYYYHHFYHFYYFDYSCTYALK